MKKTKSDNQWIKQIKHVVRERHENRKRRGIQDSLEANEDTCTVHK